MNSRQPTMGRATADPPPHECVRTLRHLSTAAILFTVVPVLGGPAFWATPAHATYSIVAADRANNQVGGAGASCIGGTSVTIIFGAVAGVGAVHAQALVNVAGRDEAVRLLGTGASPEEIIAAITSPTFDAQAAQRQYGVVDLMGRAAGYTGAEDLFFASDRQGEVERTTYSIQGNILTGGAVLDQAETAFRAPACDLAERLIRGIVAGAEGGQGDSRCTPNGIPADSAFLHVARPDGWSVVHLDVRGTAPASAVVRLEEAYDAWAAQHPCTPAADGGSGTRTQPDAGVAAAPSSGGCQGTAPRTNRSASGLAGSLLLVLLVTWAARRRPSRPSPSAARSSPGVDRGWSRTARADAPGTGSKRAEPTATPRR